MNEIEKIIKEKSFDDFIDNDLYENATTAVWELVKAAYNDAWEKARIIAVSANSEKE